MSFFRYPGGKAKLAGPILNKVEELTKDKEINTYIEPFFGGGAIGLKILEKKTLPNLKSFVFNDTDFGLYCLWRSVHRSPKQLIKKIQDFEPTTESFYSFKEQLISADFKNSSLVDIGFMKLAVHQMSYSGLGTKAGGPIGGKKQSSDYGVGCRWSPDSLSKKVLKYSDLLGTTRFSRGFCADFEPFFYAAMSYAYTEKNPYPFMYLDPPYYVKGSELYAQSFSVGDHVKLSEKLKLYKFPWLLSYDDCPEIRELYNWASIEEISVNYTIRTARAKNELLIFQK